VALIFGVQATLRAMYIPASLLIMSIFFFYIYGMLEQGIMIAISIIIIIPLCYFAYKLHSDMTIKRAEQIQKYMKFNMLSIVISFIVHDIFTRLSI
jgi:4-hydroxybenzoate polyprenyltransferase